MDIKKLANIVLSIGICALAAAIFWWNSFYGPIMHGLGGTLSDSIGCLYSSNGACAVASGVATFLGKASYEPGLFWAGASIAIIGFVMRASVKT